MFSVRSVSEGFPNPLPNCVWELCLVISGQVRPRQGTEICNFGAPSPVEALHWIFCFFSGIYVQFSKTRPLKSGESSEKSSGENRVKSCHVCGCHGFFSAPIISVEELPNQNCCGIHSALSLGWLKGVFARGCFQHSSPPRSLREQFLYWRQYKST